MNSQAPFRRFVNRLITDHTEYRAPRSFMGVPERSPAPTPAVWPKGGTRSSAGGPCLSPSTRLRTGSASWSLLRPASISPNEARRGVNGFGTFFSTTMVAPFGTRQATSSPAGAKPGNTAHQVDTRVGDTQCEAFTCQLFFTGTFHDGFSIHIVKL
jgi:hypothetical protein